MCPQMRAAPQSLHGELTSWRRQRKLGLKLLVWGWRNVNRVLITKSVSISPSERNEINLIKIIVFLIIILLCVISPSCVSVYPDDCGDLLWFGGGDGSGVHGNLPGTGKQRYGVDASGPAQQGCRHQPCRGGEEQIKDPGHCQNRIKLTQQHKRLNWCNLFLLWRQQKWQDLNVVSSLLKSFFRKLPEPLFTNGESETCYDKPHSLHLNKTLILCVF